MLYAVVLQYPLSNLRDACRLRFRWWCEPKPGYIRVLKGPYQSSTFHCPPRFHIARRIPCRQTPAKQRTLFKAGTEMSTGVSLSRARLGTGKRHIARSHGSYIKFRRREKITCTPRWDGSSWTKHYIAPPDPGATPERRTRMAHASWYKSTGIS